MRGICQRKNDGIGDRQAENGGNRRQGSHRMALSGIAGRKIVFFNKQRRFGKLNLLIGRNTQNFADVNPTAFQSFADKACQMAV